MEQKLPDIKNISDEELKLIYADMILAYRDCLSVIKSLLNVRSYKLNEIAVMNEELKKRGFEKLIEDLEKKDE